MGQHNQQQYTTKCILKQNVYNEKMFAVCYLLFAGVLLVNVCSLVSTLTAHLVSSRRVQHIKK